MACNPRYAHGYRPENKRRTKHIARTLNPEWHQTLVFQDVARGELQNKVLELTVWDYDRFKANDFLGELILELSGEDQVKLAVESGLRLYAQQEQVNRTVRLLSSQGYVCMHNKSKSTELSGCCRVRVGFVR